MFYRRTLFGIFYFYMGRIVAVTFIIKLMMTAKNVVYPQYSTEMMDKTAKTIVQIITQILGPKRTKKIFGSTDEGPIALTFVIEYTILFGMALLIASNVQSFLKKLLVTLKNIMRDNDIEISYSTTILIFSFIMGTYYFSILLQMSM